MPEHPLAAVVRVSFQGEPFACSFPISLQNVWRVPFTVGQIACVCVGGMRDAGGVATLQRLLAAYPAEDAVQEEMGGLLRRLQSSGGKDDPADTPVLPSHLNKEERQEAASPRDNVPSFLAARQRAAGAADTSQAKSRQAKSSQADTAASGGDAAKDAAAPSACEVISASYLY